MVFTIKEDPSVVLVHRITGSVPGGYTTRGDSNRFSDPHPVPPERILGVVTHLTRRHRRRKVTGGTAGLLLASLSLVLRSLRRPLKLFCNALGATGIPRLLWQPRITTLRLQTPDGPLVKYLWRNRTVARWWPAGNRFVCGILFSMFLKKPADPVEEE